MENKNLVWEFANKVRGRVPEEMVVEFVISFAYDYCNRNNLIPGSDTELHNIAGESLDRIPSDLKFDLENMFLDLSFNEIKGIVSSSLFIKQRFMDNSNDNLLALTSELLELSNGDSIFDLGSGLGGFLIGTLNLAQECSIELSALYGVEINYKQHAISKMVLEILTFDSSVKSMINYANILTDKYELTYNKGFVYPPLGMKLMGNDLNYISIFKNIVLSTRNSVEWIFIDKLLNNLKGNDARAVALVTGRTLFSAVDRDYREEILKSGMLEGIIELPQGIVDNTSIKLFLLIFSKNNKNVRLFDASMFSSKRKFNGAIKVDVKQIIDFYYGKDVAKKDISELTDLSNWIPSTALLTIDSPKNGVKLSEVAHVFTGSQYTVRNFQEALTDKETGYKLLTSSDIQDGLIDESNLQSIDNKDNKLDKFALEYEDVIITSKSSKVKIAVIDFEPKDKIIVTGGMIIARVDNSKLNPTFLKVFLESDQGQLILKSIQKGISIITINATELSNIIIPLPQLDVQYILAKKYNRKLSSLMALKAEVLKIEDELKNFYYEEIEEVLS